MGDSTSGKFETGLRIPDCIVKGNMRKLVASPMVSPCISWRGTERWAMTSANERHRSLRRRYGFCSSVPAVAIVMMLTDFRVALLHRDLFT